tara:strand:- start:97 stop:771 length:675 start_codon:yes stop_codon:yes gene_type:complete
MDNKKLSIFYKNGIHINYICTIIMFLDFKLGMYLYLKVFSRNYYVNFNYLYNNPQLYTWKHLVRLTDTGHIANFLFYLFPSTLPVCHNIQFIISFGYYITTVFFNMKDIDNKKDRDIIPEVHTIHSHLNHSIGYLILFYYNTQNYYEFNDNTLYLSYLWVYTWLFLIYFPWRYITNDCVYSILDNNTSIIKKVTIFVVFHILLYVANNIGYYVQISSNHLLLAC